MMGREWFVYSFVAQGTEILAEYAACASNSPGIAAQWLKTLPAPNKYTFSYDHHTFSFLVEDGYVYGIVAKESAGAEILFEFLKRVRDEFQKRYGNNIGEVTTKNNIRKEFWPIMERHMQEMDKLAKVKTQISEVQVIILDNIEKIVGRGEHIDSVAAKANELYNSSKEYQTTATAIKRKMWYQNMKIKLAILGVLLILALILWLSICHGFSCAK